MSRFFMDHGMIHDRVTGQHIHTNQDIEPGATERLFALLQELSAPRAEVGTPEVTAAMIDAALEFSKQSSYLSHPKVRHFRGTENGDSIEAWNRDCFAELCRAILAASGDRSPQFTKDKS